ncbi:hypothetical protein PCNPT3_04690 [Psychromonas sp. CNPT3]|uniref:hypothetical protein n=1 Tax=Psychromonas sp. CNPT3 TaxID=314282 RepID=UPI00006E428C|nr:hypothetical protein [Psychromonas sp. CNPT3]AGH80880.1 hypothetical protein PCNPT3_04690 [Psychromonas sp. CNPT3]
MSELNTLYSKMWTDSIDKFNTNTCVVDPLIHYPADLRRGITILSYFDQSVGVNISNFLAELKTIEPHQYYYPQNELHLTILSIISCITGFKLSDIEVEAYCDVFKETLKNMGGFKVQYKGITTSSSCILIQGFPDIKQLKHLRDSLRINFKKAKLQSTIDSRYKIITAHSTVMRCLTPFENSHNLVNILHKYKNHDFGTLDVNSLELVFNNWYQNLGITKHLSRVELKTRAIVV